MVEGHELVLRLDQRRVAERRELRGAVPRHHRVALLLVTKDGVLVTEQLDGRRGVRHDRFFIRLHRQTRRVPRTSVAGRTRGNRPHGGGLARRQGPNEGRGVVRLPLTKNGLISLVKDGDARSAQDQGSEALDAGAVVEEIAGKMAKLNPQVHVRNGALLAGK